MFSQRGSTVTANHDLQSPFLFHLFSFRHTYILITYKNPPHTTHIDLYKKTKACTHTTIHPGLMVFDVVYYTLWYRYRVCIGFRCMLQNWLSPSSLDSYTGSTTGMTENSSFLINLLSLLSLLPSSLLPRLLLLLLLLLVVVVVVVVVTVGVLALQLLQ